MRGGIDRAAGVVARERDRLGASRVAYLDAGDSLFTEASLPDALVAQEERKAHALWEAMDAMGARARSVGERDLSRGADFWTRLSKNDVPVEDISTFTLHGVRVARVASRSLEQLGVLAKRARSEGAALVLGVADVSMAQLRARDWARDPNASALDVVIAVHADAENDGEESQFFRGPPALARIQSKGRSLLRIDVSPVGNAGTRFQLSREGVETERARAALSARIALLDREVNAPSLAPELKRLKQAKLEELFRRREREANTPPPNHAGANTFSVRFVPLEPTLPSDPTVKAIVSRYDRDVGRINLAWAREHGRECPAPAKGTATFIGSAACRECHAEAFPVWEASKHAHAFATLEQAGKSLHLNCVGCHVTGYQQPGGVCRLDKVEEARDVGCEACHGAGSLHAKRPDSDNILLGNTSAACVGCHDPENSPHFDFARYLPLILGPGHGAPRP